MARPIWVKSLPKIGMHDNVYDTFHTEIFIATALYSISSFVLVRIVSLSPLWIRSHSLRRPRSRSCLLFYIIYLCARHLLAFMTISAVCVCVLSFFLLLNIIASTNKISTSGRLRGGFEQDKRQNLNPTKKIKCEWEQPIIIIIIIFSVRERISHNVQHIVWAIGIGLRCVRVYANG